MRAGAMSWPCWGDPICLLQKQKDINMLPINNQHGSREENTMLQSQKKKILQHKSEIFQHRKQKQPKTKEARASIEMVQDAKMKGRFRRTVRRLRGDKGAQEEKKESRITLIEKENTKRKDGK